MGENLESLGSSDTIAAIEDNLVACWSTFATYPSVDFYHGGDMVRFVSGVDYPLCNGVFDACFTEADQVEKVDKALVVFKSRGLPFLWWTGPSARPENLGEVLLAKGFSLAQEAPGMALDLSIVERGPAPPDDLSIERVGDKAHLEQWGRVFTAAFEIPDYVGGFFVAVMEHLGLDDLKPLQHYLGYWGGELAACATLFTHEGVAGIYNVATLAEFRGKGIGSSLSRHMLEEALASRCRLAILHATPKGLPVYVKLGFSSYCTIRAYLMEK
jgi:GNAT superfamily N-acetyltransferase